MRACIYIYVCLCLNGWPSCSRFDYVRLSMRCVACSTWLLVRSWTIDLQYISSISPFTRKENLLHTWRWRQWWRSLPKVLIHRGYTIIPILLLRWCLCNWTIDRAQQCSTKVSETRMNEIQIDQITNKHNCERRERRRNFHPFGIWSQDAEMGLRFPVGNRWKIYRKQCTQAFRTHAIWLGERERERVRGKEREREWVCDTENERQSSVHLVCMPSENGWSEKSVCVYRKISYIISKCNT